MNFDPANWFLGIFTALMLAVVGTIIKFYVTRRLISKPELDWFVGFEGSFPSDKGIHPKSVKLFFAADEGDPDNFSWDKTQNLRDDLDSLRNTTCIIIDNQGDATAEKVSLLVSKKPVHLELIPRMPVAHRETADGYFEFEISSVPALSQVRVIFYGIKAYAIQRVSHSGNEIEQKRYSRLRPFIKKPSSFWIIFLSAYAAGAWTLIIVDKFVVGEDVSISAEQTDQ